jgi:pimeloyl-ACP methyl ester carboxylesterase
MAHLHRAVEYTTWRARGRAKLARRFATSVYDPELHPDGHALLEADARRADPRCVLAARRELAACVPQAQVGLACPVLVVVGGNISRAHSDAMHALADGFGPDRLRIVEGAGHFVQLDAPAVLERAIVDHVERVDHARGDSWLPLVPEQV